MKRIKRIKSKVLKSMFNMEAFAPYRQNLLARGVACEIQRQRELARQQQA